jgi:host factor-I protein
MTLDTTIPSTRIFQRMIQEQTTVEIKIITDELLIGKMKWLDSDCLCLLDNFNVEIYIMRSAVCYIKPK